MTEIDLLWIAVTLALGLVAVLSAQIGMLQRRVRKLENRSSAAEPVTLHPTSDGAQIYNDLYAELNRRAARDPQFRHIFANFPEPAPTP